MDSENTEDLIQSRKGICLSPQETEPMNGRPDVFAESYSHMLIEDVCNQILPIDSHFGKGSYLPRIAPEDRMIEALICRGIAGQRYERNIAYALHEFFRNCVQAIGVYGNASYEIVYSVKPGTSKPMGFRFEPLSPVPHGRHGQYCQRIPRQIAKSKGVPSRMKLPEDIVLVCNPRISLRITETLRCLATLSDPVSLDLALSKSGERRERVPYDWEAHRRSHSLAIASTCRDIGWEARNLFRNDILEYYSIHRKLKFARFVMELRDSILAMLNEGIARVGKELGFSAQIVLEGLPVLGDVEKAEGYLRTGERPFKEIYGILLNMP